MKTIVREVERDLRAAAKRAGIAPAVAAKRQSIYNTQLDVLGLTLPELRQINKAGFSFTLDGPQPARKRPRAQSARRSPSNQPAAEARALKQREREILSCWDQVWSESQLFEAKLQPLLYYEDRIGRLDAKLHWPALKRWVADVDNWEHSDRFSKIFAQLNEDAPEIVLPVLERWNRSRKPWLRRQSIVSLLCFDNLRDVRPPAAIILKFVAALLEDTDLYVQKGVGWTLRECGRAYPDETMRFLRQHIRTLRPVAFSAATEKISPEEKRALKDLRG